MSKYIAIILALLVLSSATMFAHIRDTVQGTQMENSCTIYYEDRFAGTNTWDTGDEIETAVAAIYGDSMQYDTTASFIGDTCPYNFGYDTIIFQVMNTGNTADTFYARFKVKYFGTAETWTTRAYGGYNWNLIADTTAGGVNYPSGWTIGDSIGLIAEDGVGTVAVEVIHNNTLIPYARGGAGETVDLVIYSANNDNYSEYLGDNGDSYAEDNSSSTETFFVVVLAPWIDLYKEVNCTLNDVYSAPIPGATLKYAINYQNTGNDTGQDVSVYDVIPSQCTFDTISYTNNGGDTWDMFLNSRTDNISTTYGYYEPAGSWIRTYGKIGGVADPNDYDDSSITYVRWENAGVPRGGANGDSGYLLLDVYIN